jgi:uncharacterized protein
MPAGPSRERSLLIWLAFTFLFVAGCRGSSEPDPGTHRAEIEQWRKERLTRLTSDNGWLTLCGLYWLKEGRNSCGSDSSNDVILPQGKAPRTVGTFWRTDSLVRFESKNGVEVKTDSFRVSKIELRTDADAQGPTILHHGSLSFYVIRRGEKLGVRVKDKENAERVHFQGIDYFPIDLKWRCVARFTRYSPPHIIKITSLAGTIEDTPSPGALLFDLDGNPYRLDAISERGSENELFVMFTDATSGQETYGGGRQLYTTLPNADGEVILDLNKAYNWPCVFTQYATCPIPPLQNRLPIRVEAGEKMYAAHQSEVP